MISIISTFDRILKYAAQREEIALRGTLLRNSTAVLLVKGFTQMCGSWLKMKTELKKKYLTGRNTSSSFLNMKHSKGTT